MAALPRRTALRLIGSAPLAVSFAFSAIEAASASQHAARAVAAGTKGLPYKPRYFTAHEWKTVRLLADFVIPRDERSGSATDAGVPEFIDFLMADPQETERGRESRQVAMRGGLAWIDRECRQRCGQPFVDAAAEQQRAVLDAIAYTKLEGDEAPPAPRDQKAVSLRSGQAFFNSFRDLVASGFWSSKMGIEDLGYQGNTATVWQGPPPEVLRKLGLED
jgi:gluconate 2-dehydrogenase gamma chain